MGRLKRNNKSATDTGYQPSPRGYSAMRAVGLSVPNQVNDKNQRWLTFLLILSSPGATSLLDHHVIVSNLISVQPIKIS